MGRTINYGGLYNGRLTNVLTIISCVLGYLKRFYGDQGGSLTLNYTSYFLYGDGLGNGRVRGKGLYSMYLY